MTDIDLEFESTLTDKYQTTVPTAVRKALRLDRRDRLVFRVDPASQTVTVAKRGAAAAEEDPVIGKFLSFLARDIELAPSHVQPLSAEMVARVRALTDGVEIGDLDAPLDADE